VESLETRQSFSNIYKSLPERLIFSERAFSKHLPPVLAEMKIDCHFASAAPVLLFLNSVI
jgi:hypothetical protein